MTCAQYRRSHGCIIALHGFGLLQLVEIAAVDRIEVELRQITEEPLRDKLTNLARLSDYEILVFRANQPLPALLTD